MSMYAQRVMHCGPAKGVLHGPGNSSLTARMYAWGPPTFRVCRCVDLEERVPVPRSALVWPARKSLAPPSAPGRPPPFSLSLNRDCVNSPPTARGSREAGFTQPRDHLLADPCSEFAVLHLHSSYTHTHTRSQLWHGGSGAERSGAGNRILRPCMLSS